MTARDALVAEPAESSQSAERRSRRDGRASLTTRAGLIAKALYLLVRVVSIPLAMRLLGADRYGLWLTVGSFVNWLGLFEFGIGYGLVNALATAGGHSDF